MTIRNAKVLRIGSRANGRQGDLGEVLFPVGCAVMRACILVYSTGPVASVLFILSLSPSPFHSLLLFILSFSSSSSLLFSFYLSSIYHGLEFSTRPPFVRSPLGPCSPSKSPCAAAEAR